MKIKGMYGNIIDLEDDTCFKNFEEEKYYLNYGIYYNEEFVKNFTADFEEALILFDFVKKIVNEKRHTMEIEGFMGIIKTFQKLYGGKNEKGKDLQELKTISSMYKRHFDMNYDLKNVINKYYGMHKSLIGVADAIERLYDEYCIEVEEDMEKFDFALEGYNANFSYDAKKLYINENQDVDHLIECLPSKEIINADYELQEKEDIIPYSLFLYQRYVLGDTELEEFKDTFEPYKGTIDVPFTKEEFLSSIKREKIITIKPVNIYKSLK